MRKIGIMGGTFDPIHNGHLMLAEEAYKIYHLDEIWFLPNGRPPHKNIATIGSDIQHRVEMVKLAIAGHPEYRLETYEAFANRTSYSYQTLEHFHNCYPKDKFYFIIGADSLFALDNWVHPERIFPTCTLLTAYRDEIDTNQKMLEQIHKLESSYNSVDIRLMVTPLVHVSSHELRQKIKNGESIHEYVPEAVEEYIRKYQLFDA